MSSDVTLNTLAERINSSWQRTAQGVLETARLCADARESLSESELEELKTQIDFSRPTFTKLVKIGANSQLYEEQVSALLPPHFSIVYQIASMDDDQRELALDQGIISPGMSRTGLREWVASQSGKEATSKTEQPEVIATLRATKAYSADLRNKVIEALRKLEEQFGFLLDGPPDPEQELKQAIKEIDQEIRGETRRYIAKLKKQRLHAQGRPRLSKQERQEHWPYTEEQLKIASDSDWERCDEVLNLVGMSDEFKRIKDAALRIHDYTEEMLKAHANDDREQTLKELKVILTGEGGQRVPTSKSKSGSREATR